MPHVISTLATGQTYVDYTPAGNVNVAIKSVSIKGGHGVANKSNLLEGHVLTPNGVVTEVSDDELSFLKSNAFFMDHVKKGFVTIVERAAKPKADKIAADMNQDDLSAPLQDKDFKEGGRAAKMNNPKMNKVQG